MKVNYNSLYNGKKFHIQLQFWCYIIIIKWMFLVLFIISICNKNSSETIYHQYQINNKKPSLWIKVWIWNLNSNLSLFHWFFIFIYILWFNCILFSLTVNIKPLLCITTFLALLEACPFFLPMPIMIVLMLAALVVLEEKPPTFELCKWWK